MKAPAKTETRTGTTTASHPDVVVGVVAAGEAAAGTETEGAGLATLATDLPRYENSFDPSTSLLSMPPDRMGLYHWCLANA